MRKPRKHSPVLNEQTTAKDSPGVKQRLEYLRTKLQAERISYDELHELQSLASHIDSSDVELLEAAGVPECTCGGDCIKCDPEGHARRSDNIETVWEVLGIKLELRFENAREPIVDLLSDLGHWLYDVHNLTAQESCTLLQACLHSAKNHIKAEIKK